MPTAIGHRIRGNPHILVWAIEVAVSTIANLESPTTPIGWTGLPHVILGIRGIDDSYMVVAGRAVRAIVFGHRIGGDINLNPLQRTAIAINGVDRI